MDIITLALYAQTSTAAPALDPANPTIQQFIDAWALGPTVFISMVLGLLINLAKRTQVTDLFNGFTASIVAAALIALGDLVLLMVDGDISMSDLISALTAFAMALTTATSGSVTVDDPERKLAA